jgi:hypothetical protein
VRPGLTPNALDQLSAPGTGAITNARAEAVSDVMVGYSKLFGGGFLEDTAGPNKAVDSDSFYFIYSYRW